MPDITPGAQLDLARRTVHQIPVLYGNPEAVAAQMILVGVALAEADSVTGVTDSNDALLVLQDGVLKVASALQAGPLLQAAGVSLGSTTVARVSGATVSGTTSPTTLLASAISKPAATVNDVFRIRSSGTVINLTGGSLSCTLTCAYAGTNLWTPYALSVPTISGKNYVIDVTVRCPTVGSSVAELVAAELRVSDGSQLLEAASCRGPLTSSPTVNNSGTLGFTLTATHSGNSASFSTVGNGAFIEKIPAAA